MSDWDVLLQERIKSLSNAQKRKLVLYIDAMDPPSPRGIEAKNFVEIVKSSRIPPALVEQLESAMKSKGRKSESES